MTPQEEEAEERAVLERELAAELAALRDAGDEDEDEEVEAVGHPPGSQPGYKRLDLESVLRCVAREAKEDRPDVQEKESDREKTWARLMESVAFCETQVFNVFDAEMDALATQLLPRLAAAAQSVVAQRGEAIADAAAAGARSADGRTSKVPFTNAASARSPNVHDAANDSDRDATAVRLPPPQATVHDQQSSTTLDERIEQEPVALTAVAARPPVALSHVVPDVLATVLAVDPEGRRRERSTTRAVATPPHGDVVPTTKPSPSWIVPPVRDASLRVRVQQNALRAQQEMDAWLDTKQRELELQETQHETTRRRAARERDERGAMASEERWTRSVVDCERRAHEREWMQREEEISQRVETARAREAQLQDHERKLLAQEEARELKRRRLVRETQRKEKLVEEQSRLRRARHRVMDELVAVARARTEAIRKAQDAARRRAHREASAMRSEEHGMRRVLVYEKMVREEHVRQREKQAMGTEDALATALQDQERHARERQREQYEVEAMEMEEARSRVMETLWRLRVQRLRKWVNGDLHQWRVRCRYHQWRRVVQDLVEHEQSDRRNQAARVIQRGTRQWLTQKRQHHERATAQAARVVQSAFRGFHVRRKFQNALDMAQRMALRDGRDEDEFGEVNLDEWLGAPPELEDDWDKPAVMPVVPRQTGHSETEQEEQPAADRGEDEGEDDEEDEEDEETLRTTTAVGIAPRIVATPTRWVPPSASRDGVATEGGGNLAAVLWNKMRRRTQKQRHAQEEKQKQQDPVYRAQKLLAKTAIAASPQASNHHNNQQQPTPPAASTSIAWATNADKKKAPKVKLPSLVERLRKKTAAAR